MGAFFCLLALTLYLLYVLKIGSISRAIGRNHDKLITSGIFGWCRNPQSLARAIGSIAVGIWGRSFHALFLAIIWIIINHSYILIEEKYLERTFGKFYSSYCALTPRYLRFLHKTIEISNE
jgi:protein-S-isoprenylcysteine O-methyltransferase Ste14